MAQLFLRPIAVSLLTSLVLTACGGGDFETSPPTSPASTFRSNPASAYAATAITIGQESTSALDATVQATEILVHTLPEAAAGLAVAPSAPASFGPTTLPCSSGGSATVSVSGATAIEVMNGQFDNHETYTLTFASCTAGSGLAALNGNATLSISSVSSNTLDLTLQASQLSATFGSGVTLTLTGSASMNRTSIRGADGSVTTSTHYVATTLDVQTSQNGAAASLNLARLDLARKQGALHGQTIASSLSGSHALTMDGRDMTVATVGAASFSHAGVPQTGNWLLTLPSEQLALSVDNGNVFVTLGSNAENTSATRWRIDIDTLMAPTSA